MNSPLRILVVEDMPADMELISHELRRAGVVPKCLRVESREQFLTELDNGVPDLILSDHGVPGFDAASAFTIARERCPDVPFVVVSGTAEQLGSAEVLTADGFVLKNQIKQLGPVVRRAMQKCQERSGIRENPLCLTRFNLSQAVREVMREILHSDSGRPVEWGIRPLPDVYADHALMSCALRLLVENALRLTQEQDVARILIGGADHGDEVIIHVTDNSSGAQSLRRERLMAVFGKPQPQEHFDPALQALATVRQIAQRHQGRTWAESHPGGATFSIALPLYADAKSPYRREHA
jgi:light-regulated signal transduction histidine kinase (bacteriophytochrome)